MSKTINLIEVPKRMRRNVGDNHESQKVTDDFLLNTKHYLESKYGESPSFEITLTNFIRSDGNLTYLKYKDRTVAGRIELRTEFNNVEYVFFRDLSGLEKITGPDTNS